MYLLSYVELNCIELNCIKLYLNIKLIEQQINPEWR